MKTTYLTKQHQIALFYLECIQKIMEYILSLEERKTKKEMKVMFSIPTIYNKEDWDKAINQQKEFSIWLMTRYNKVIDNITAHSYAK